MNNGVDMANLIIAGNVTEIAFQELTLGSVPEITISHFDLTITVL